MIALLISLVLLSLYLVLNIILAVAFLTLFERKVLASIQKRKGPNWTGFLGILQPLADALKLVIKENPIPQNASTILFFGGPLILLILSLSAWFVIPFNNNVVISDINIGILYVFMVSSLNALNIIIAGWSSNSRYAFLGALRSIAQVIAYEVVIGIIIINVIILSGSLNLIKIVWAQKNIWFGLVLWAQLILFFIAMLAETNRHPFDLAEAESELVSGYNVEHSSVLFAVFFLAEYANILLLCHLASLLLLGGWTLPDLHFLLVLLNQNLYESVDNFLISLRNFHPYITWFYHTVVYTTKVYLYLFAFVWVRATLPRYRYDQLMRLGWKVFVPLTLGLVFISVSLIWLFDGVMPPNGYIFHNLK
jgi:NADH-quinone oxidoreductase subunit H